MAIEMMMKGDHNDGDNGVTVMVMAMVIVWWLMLMPVQLQQGDAEMRQLQSGSREVAFTKQLRCQLKVSSWGVSFSLWPPSPVSDLSFQKYAESHQLLATCNDSQTLIGSKGICQEKNKVKAIWESQNVFLTWFELANIHIMLLRQLWIWPFDWLRRSAEAKRCPKNCANYKKTKQIF